MRKHHGIECFFATSVDVFAVTSIVVAEHNQEGRRRNKTAKEPSRGLALCGRTSLGNGDLAASEQMGIERKGAWPQERGGEGGYNY